MHGALHPLPQIRLYGIVRSLKKKHRDNFTFTLPRNRLNYLLTLRANSHSANQEISRTLEPATGPYSEPYVSSPQPPILTFPRSIPT